MDTAGRGLAMRHSAPRALDDAAGCARAAGEGCDETGRSWADRAIAVFEPLRGAIARLASGEVDKEADRDAGTLARVIEETSASWSRWIEGRIDDVVELVFGE